MNDFDSILSDMILDAAPDGILVVDGDGAIQRVNAALSLLFGYSREELLGAHVEILIPLTGHSAHEQLRAVCLAAPAIRPMGIGQELTGRRRDGTEFPMEISLSPAQTSQGAMVIACVRDVTEHRRLQAERSRHEARDHVRNFRDQVRMDLHDDVLQDMIGLALHLQASTTSGSQEADVLVPRMASAAEELRAISRRLRRYMRDLQSPLPVDGLPASFVGLRHELEAEGLAVDLSLPSHLPPVADDVAVGLFHVAQEASTNIRRHADAQSVWLSLQAQSQRLHLEVRDDGVGFETSAATRADHFGLRNMRDRAAALGGDLHIESQIGSGTRVIANVPLAPP